MPRAIFRVFLSSTFGDFQAEREKLRAEVWPRLEALCAAHGASFHVVDLRWGISPSVATTHDTIKICLDEVIRCQQLSPRPKPNFLMLIGDRYGWRPPAVQIPDADFKLIGKVVSSEDAAFLADWYRRDDNAVPPVWFLKPQTGKYSSYDAWGPVEARLTTIFHDVTGRLGLAPEQYLYSATHMEIVSGLLQLEEAKDHVFSFNREISGLPDPAPKGIARRFTDHLDDGSRDPEARKLLQVLKTQIAEVLPESQIHTFGADWIGDENKPITLNHLDDYCNAIEHSLRGIIDAEVKELAQSTPLQEELELQQQFLEDTGTLLIGRDKGLKKIQAYLQRKKIPLPLIVRAKGGAGKSALLAKAVMSQQGEGETLIYRFIGAAPRSWQPQTFLQDLITQIAEAYGQQPPDLPEEGGIKKIAEQFHEQLELATAEQPLTLFIDAIDQFNSTSPVQYSDLFPKQLPANVRMVISILEGKDSIQLEKLYPKAPLIHLEQLSPTACGKILDALLPARKLTKEQRTTILDKAKESGLPLWLTLVAPIARKMRSWDKAPELPGDIKELARYVIQKIADKHGHAITTASLRYIKLARFGLSETELQEILWRDPEVWKEFDDTRNKDQPDVTALPPVFWSRLYAELDPYINEYWMDGQLLHRYFHRVFGEVANEMNEDTRTTLHSRLADYFGSQPLYNEQQPNGRKLMEQTWHLIQANRIEESRTFITDFDFAMAKCRLNRSDDWADDFRRASNDEKSRDYRIWESFVKTNAHILRRGNDDWPAHKILLQLAIEHADDSPATIGAEKFLAEGKCDWAWLRRELRVNHAGIDPCVAVFEGHEDFVNGAFVLPGDKILSWSDDSTLRIWTQESGICLKIIEGHTGYIFGVTYLTDGRMLSWSSDNTLRLWNSDGEPLNVLEGHRDSIIKALLLTDGFLLSWSRDNTVRLWSSNGESIRVMEGHTDSIEDVLLLSDGRFISWSKDNTLRLWDAKGELIKMMEGHTKAVKGVRVLPNGRLLSWSSDNTLRLWSEDGEPLNVMDWHTDEVDGTLILPDGRILSWSFEKMRLWNSDGKRIKTLKGHTYGVSGAMMLHDGRILSWGADNTLRLWDSDGEQLKVLKGHKGSIKDVLLLHDGRFLSWCTRDSRDYTLRLWSPNGDLLKVMEGHTYPVQSVQVLSSGGFLSWSSFPSDGTVCFWSSDGELLLMAKGHTRKVEGVLILKNGLILTWARDKTMRIWNSNGEPIKFLEGYKSQVDGVLPLLNGRFLSWNNREHDVRLWSPDGEILKKWRCNEDFLPLQQGLLLSWGGSSMRLWSTNGNPYKLLKGHTSRVYGALQLNDGRILSWAGFNDGTLRLWDINGNPLKVLEGHTSFVQGAMELLDGRILSWSGDKSLRLWSSNGEPLSALVGHTDQVNSVLLLPDGRFLSWAGKMKDCCDNNLRLWGSNGEHLKVLEGHTGLVSGALLMPDGRILSWCGEDWGRRSNDYSIRLWSSNGEPLRVLEGHADEVLGVLMLPDARILSWSRDNTIRLWDSEGESQRILERSRREVMILSDGRILLRARDSLLILNTFGEPLKTLHVTEMIKSEPLILKECFPEFLRTEEAGLDSLDNMAFIGTSVGHKLIWQAASRCEARNLNADGRAIVTQANGQVCFLRTYNGSEKCALRCL